MKTKNSIFSGIVILSIAGIVCKALGAFSKIPLSNILTSEGIGIYQLIFPLYSLLLLISSSGIPIAISKMISENKNQAEQITRFSFKFISIVSILLSLVIMIFSELIAKIQGNINVRWAYVVISPSIFIVAIISVIRGYFQGLQNFNPTAISQIIEQIIKVIVSIVYALLLKPLGVIYSVIGAVAGITISELIAFIYLYVKYKKSISNKGIEAKLDKIDKINLRKKLVKTAIPITITSVVLPLLSLIDSVMFMQGLKLYGSTSVITSMYGVESGIVSSLLNFPLVVSASISSCLIPLISANVETEKNCCVAFKIQIFFILPIIVFYMFFSKQILSFLFNGALINAEFNLFSYANMMLILTSVSMLYIGIMQISTSILQSKNNLWYPIIVYTIAGAIKVLINLILLKVPQINIYSISISSVIMYFIIALALLIKVKKNVNFQFNYLKNILVPLSILTIIASIITINIKSNFVSLIVGGLVFVIVPYLVMICFGFFDKSELSFLPFKKLKNNQ